MTKPKDPAAISDPTDCSPLRWMSIEEVEASLVRKPPSEMAEAFRRVREKMAEHANSEQANRERLRDAQAIADFLRQPVVYSQR